MVIFFYLFFNPTSPTTEIIYTAKIVEALCRYLSFYSNLLGKKKNFAAILSSWFFFVYFFSFAKNCREKSVFVSIFFLVLIKNELKWKVDRKKHRIKSSVDEINERKEFHVVLFASNEHRSDVLKISTFITF